MERINGQWVRSEISHEEWRTKADEYQRVLNKDLERNKKDFDKERATAEKRASKAVGKASSRSAASSSGTWSGSV